jgi:hypothetical protein
MHIYPSAALCRERFAQQGNWGAGRWGGAFMQNTALYVQFQATAQGAPMLTPVLETWRSRMQGSDLPFAQLKRDPFYSRLLVELNDISRFLESVSTAQNLSALRDELQHVLARHKPTGTASDPDVCARCGKKFP